MTEASSAAGSAGGASGEALASPLAHDELGMWAAAVGLPEQVSAAAAAGAALGEGLRSAAGTGPWSDVTILGTGAAALAGAAVAELAPHLAPQAVPVPVVVAPRGEPPPWTGGRSLVVALSWSGETPATVAGADAARRAGATVVPVAGGGPLGDATAAAGGQAAAALLAAVPQSRAAFGAMVAVPLVVLDHLGVAPGAGDLVRSAAGELAHRRDRLGAGSAADLARRIGRTFPLVHGTTALTAVAARRWKAQVNLNAKSPAFWSAYPDLCHDEVAGWGQHGDVTRQVLTVLVLRQRDEPPALAARVAAMRELLDEVVADVVDVRAEAGGALGSLLDLVLLGDLVSLHLAAAAGIDPGPVPVLGDVPSA